MRIEHRGWKIAGLLGFAAFCIAILVYLYTAAGGDIRLKEPYTAKAVIPTAFQLTENGDIRRSGVKVGVITSIESQGNAGIVGFEVDDETAPLYKNATVTLRTKTLVGENYLDINPGSPAAGKLPKGGTLPLEQAGDAVQLDEVLSTLSPGTRKQVKRNLDTLGPGLDGKGDEINQLFASARPTARDGGLVFRILSDQRRQVAAVVDDLGSTMQAFGDRTQDVRTLARGARQTAIAAASRDEKLRESFEELDPTLEQATSSLNTLGDFSGRAQPVVGQLASRMAQLTPVLGDLRPAIGDTRELFRVLPAALKKTDPLLTQLKPFSRELRPVFPSLDAFLRQVGPIVDYGAPFSKDLGAQFANNGDVFTTRDAQGHRGRVHLQQSAESVTAFSPELKKAYDALIAAGGFESFLGTEQNAYPKPGDVDDPTPFSGEYPRVGPGK